MMIFPLYSKARITIAEYPEALGTCFIPCYTALLLRLLQNLI